MSSVSPATPTNAITEFLGRERTRLIRFILRKFHHLSEMDAEDVLQDLILAMFDRTDPTIYVENLTAYIYRSISNRVIDWLRKNRRNDSGLEWDEAIEVRSWRTEGEDRFDLGSIIEQGEVRERIVQALDDLEPRQRAVWIATEIEGYSFKELSHLWNEPMGTLLSRKHRAMKALQVSLRDLREGND